MTSTPAFNAASTTEDQIAAWLDEIDQLNAEVQSLRNRIQELHDDVGEAMGRYKMVIGGRTIKRHKRQPRTREWQSDDLLRRVLDSSPVDLTTGELIDEEAQAEEVGLPLLVWRLRQVYGLKGYNARLTELARRQIAYDEYATVEPVPGWQIEVR